MFKLQVESWDGALAVRRPEELVVALDLSEGDEVDLLNENGVLFIVKLPRESRSQDGQ